MADQYKYRFLFSGGGTGGHLFPVVAVAEKLKEVLPACEILFVGTPDKIESRVIPELGYNYRAIPVAGFARNNGIKNILFPFKLFFSLIKSLAIALKYKPLAAIGAGAYVTGPILWASSIMGAKIVLLEQNSFPGVTNRMLEKKASTVHLAFEDSKQYFRYPEKLKVTGNPVRSSLQLIDKNEAKAKLGLDPDKQTVVVLGGSLGAKSINETIAGNIEKFGKDIQLVWQTGKIYYENYKNLEKPGVKVLDFIDDMAAVYSSADLIVARAGATTIAEVTNLGLPVVFVPSPNVAADHQYKNAKSIADLNAAVVIKDIEIEKKMIPEVMASLGDTGRLNDLGNNIKKFAKPDAAEKIVDDLLRLTGIKARRD
ncbi:MAG: UDP-N-acetylglucosamine--N-acetylmuramyl-(pentapeptide) pyrophosphoryl-undecaprenol N-acetylglucosamine transferase [Melioribacteraceae bacterium]|nr:MAG: UDP-N-acetylglucosamine--N-acetylmuramyl-(pentapeptide) pyrophosphoryl-undecaprenol N-acetylglucosamine transferase [Melioribacteraceae bacterium]